MLYAVFTVKGILVFVLSARPMDSVHVSVGIYSYICVTSFFVMFFICYVTKFFCT